MEISDSLIASIDEKIGEIWSDFKEVRGLILTESDLKCQLYAKLFQIPEISTPNQTEAKSIKAIAIHTEVPWYNEHNKLAIRPDITILDTKELIIRNNTKLSRRLPSKGFEFSGNAIVFELKLVREVNGISQRYFKKKIKPDFEKIERLFKLKEKYQERERIFFFFVIFNTTGKACEEFTKFFNSHKKSTNHSILYCPSNMQANF